MAFSLSGRKVQGERRHRIGIGSQYGALFHESERTRNAPPR